MEDNKPNVDPEEVNEEVVEQPVEEPAEENEEQQSQQEEEEPQEEPVEENPEERPPSRRESLRIQKLIEKMKSNQQTVPAFEHQGMDYGQQLEADPEVVKQLESDRRAAAEQAYSQGLQQAQSIQFHTRLEIDAPKVTSKYSQLNPEDKAHFNPVLADAVNTWYLNMTGYDQESGLVGNPNIRYSEFVDSIFELGNEIAGQKEQATVRNIAKQAATTGLRPDGSASKKLNLNQPLSQMNDEELAAYGRSLGLETKKHS